MNVETTKRLRSAETVLERARRALPEPHDAVRDQFGLAIGKYQEHFSQRDFGPALDALRGAAELVATRGGVWKDLIRAAEFLKLGDKLPDLEKRFVASASLAGNKRSPK
jgi:hypothetical protein